MVQEAKTGGQAAGSQLPDHLFFLPQVFSMLLIDEGLMPFIQVSGIFKVYYKGAILPSLPLFIDS